jgi:6-phosphogluconolactonase (cycloisomerase 2 family)
MFVGVEGSEGITALALSPSKKFLAVCEKGERAICTVYVAAMDAKSNTLVFKKKKVLTSMEYHAKEFISVAFSP